MDHSLKECFHERSKAMVGAWREVWSSVFLWKIRKALWSQMSEEKPCPWVGIWCSTNTVFILPLLSHLQNGHKKKIYL